MPSDVLLALHALGRHLARHLASCLREARGAVRRTPLRHRSPVGFESWRRRHFPGLEPSPLAEIAAAVSRSAGVPTGALHPSDPVPAGAEERLARLGLEFDRRRLRTVGELVRALTPLRERAPTVHR